MTIRILSTDFRFRENGSVWGMPWEADQANKRSGRWLNARRVVLVSLAGLQEHALGFWGGSARRCRKRQAGGENAYSTWRAEIGLGARATGKTKTRICPTGFPATDGHEGCMDRPRGPPLRPYKLADMIAD